MSTEKKQIGLAVTPPEGHCKSVDFWNEASRALLDIDREALSGGHMTDFEVAYETAMLTRNDLNYEAVLITAKERIRWLSVQLADTTAKLQAETIRADKLQGERDDIYAALRKENWEKADLEAAQPIGYAVAFLNVRAQRDEAVARNDLFMKAQDRATALWHAQGGDPMTLPDSANLMVWLMDQILAEKTRAEKAEAALMPVLMDSALSSKDAYDRIRAPETLVLQDWKPIKDAPKWDGDPGKRAIYLLGFCPDDSLDPESCKDVVWWEPRVRCETGKRRGLMGVWMKDAGECEPTMWQHLPAAPVVREAMT